MHSGVLAHPQGEESALGGDRSGLGEDAPFTQTGHDERPGLQTVTGSKAEA